MKEASRHQDVEAWSKRVIYTTGAFFRGVRVGTLAVAVLAVIGAALEGNRRLKAEGREQGEGRLRCLAWLPLVAVLPGEEWPWAFVWVMGGIFGGGCYLLFDWFGKVKAEFGEERLNGPLNSDGIRERLHARVLTEEDHWELLFECHVGAMISPHQVVDLRGVPAMWGLSQEQRAAFIKWAEGKVVRWGEEDQEWQASLKHACGHTFVKFGQLPVIIPRDETEKIIVAKGGARA